MKEKGKGVKGIKKYTANKMEDTEKGSRRKEEIQLKRETQQKQK